MIMNNALRRELGKIIPGRILYDELMKNHTSMGVGGRADAVFSPTCVEELKTLCAFLREQNIPFVPVGNCTNIIVKDGGYRGAVISLKGLRNMYLEKKDADYWRVFAEAGVSLTALVSYAANESLTGMEFCSGIPGSIGGAVKMNAGAYGWEIKDVLEKVSLLKKSGEIIEAKRDVLHFAYRKLHLNEDTVIIGAAFLLKRGNKDEIRREINMINSLRKDKHPLDYRNAGSIFKNPQDAPAGRLIEEAGLKGVRSGDAQISEKHANFIINLGNAKAADVLDLMEIVKKKVFEEKGITLEAEVVILGDE